MVHKISYEQLNIAKRQWRIDANTSAFDRSVIAFQFAVALRITGRSLYMRHPTNFDKLLKIFCDKLWAIVGYDSWIGMGKLLLCSL